MHAYILDDEHPPSYSKSVGVLMPCGRVDNADARILVHQPHLTKSYYIIHTQLSLLHTITSIETLDYLESGTNERRYARPNNCSGKLGTSRTARS